jgi:hypothetical protein
MIADAFFTFLEVLFETVLTDLSNLLRDALRELRGDKQERDKGGEDEPASN